MGRKRRRLPRLLLNAATIVSLAVCLAVVAMWVRSYSRTDKIHRVDTGWSGQGVISRSGGIVFWTRDIAGLSGGPEGWEWSSETTPVNEVPYGQVRWRVLGFSSAGIVGSTLAYDGRSIPFHDEYVRMPYWTVAALCGVLSCALLRVHAERRTEQARVTSHSCAACGYDLRATPDRCPECGALPAPPSA